MITTASPKRKLDRSLRYDHDFGSDIEIPDWISVAVTGSTMMVKGQDQERGILEVSGTDSAGFQIGIDIVPSSLLERLRFQVRGIRFTTVPDPASIEFGFWEPTLAAASGDVRGIIYNGLSPTINRMTGRNGGTSNSRDIRLEVLHAERQARNLELDLDWRLSIDGKGVRRHDVILKAYERIAGHQVWAESLIDVARSVQPLMRITGTGPCAFEITGLSLETA